MDFLVNIIIFLVTIFVLVVVHEWGHYIVARWFGIKVLRFSIGFGKAIWKRTTKSGMEFAIAIIPLGGYVKLLDEREGKVSASDYHLAFNRRSVWQRFAVVFAGPLTNFLLAIIAFWLALSIGIQFIKPIVGKVTPQSIAANAGLQTHDEFMSVGHYQTPNWQSVYMALIRNIGDREKLPIKVNYKGEIKHYKLDLYQWRVTGLTPKLLENLGFKPYLPKIPAVIGKLVKNGPAAIAGLQTGDRIIAVNRQAVSDWIEFVKTVQKYPDKTIEITIKRNGKQLTMPVNSSYRYGQGWRVVGFIGVKSTKVKLPEQLKRTIQYSPPAALKHAVIQTWRFFNLNFVVIGKLVTRKLPMTTLGGPITIYRAADMAFRQGFVVYLSFLAIISAMLAFLNVLPIPMLDGGHLMFYVVEMLRGKPVSDAAQLLALRLGLIFIVILMVQVTIYDLMRLFS